MVQRFASKKSRGILAVESRAELMYVCKADASYTRMPRAMHRHDDRVEVVFIREGSGTHIIGGRLYHTGKGDVLIYNGGVLHDESASPNAEMSVYCCAFRNLRLKGLPQNCLTEPHGSVVLKSGEQYAEFESLLNMLFDRVDSDDRFATDFCNQLLHALIVLVHSLSRENDTVSSTCERDLGERIKRYIDDHYLDDIDLKSISDELHVSHYYLAHRFKSAVGCSPIQYLIRRRIGEAQSLLINTDLSVTEIATLVGYDNSNYFNTAFKKVVGTTPNSYRRQCTG